MRNKIKTEKELDDLIRDVEKNSDPLAKNDYNVWMDSVLVKQDYLLVLNSLIHKNINCESTALHALKYGEVRTNNNILESHLIKFENKSIQILFGQTAKGAQDSLLNILKLVLIHLEMILSLKCEEGLSLGSNNSLPSSFLYDTEPVRCISFKTPNHGSYLLVIPEFISLFFENIFQSLYGKNKISQTSTKSELPQVEVLFGTAEISNLESLNLKTGDIITLSEKAWDPIAIRFNGTEVGKGLPIIMENTTIGVRVVSIIKK